MKLLDLNEKMLIELFRRGHSYIKSNINFLFVLVHIVIPNLLGLTPVGLIWFHICDSVNKILINKPCVLCFLIKFLITYQKKNLNQQTIHQRSVGSGDLVGARCLPIGVQLEVYLLEQG